MASKGYTLHFVRNIVPLTKTVQIFGALLPLEYPATSTGVLFYLRYAFVLSIGLLLCVLYGSGCYSLAQNINRGNAIQEIVLTVAKNLLYPLAIVSLITFTWKRALVSKLLHTWEHLERLLDLQNIGTKIPTKKYQLVSALACFYITGTTAFCIYVCAVHMDNFPTFANIIAPRGTTAFFIYFSLEMVAYLYAAILSYFGEVLSTLIYRHFAFTLDKIHRAFLADLENLAKRRKASYFCHQHTSHSSRSELSTPKYYWVQRNLGISSFKDALNTLWERSEQLSQLVNQAQSLFGGLLFTSYFVSFLSTCCMSYFNLVSLRTRSANRDFFSDPSVLIITSGSLLLMLCKLVLLTSFCNSLPKQLAESLSSIHNDLHQYWEDVSTEDKLLFSSYLRHLRLKNWAPTPLNLFTVSNGTLLSMASLITTFVIILLQTQSSSSSCPSKPNWNCSAVPV